MLVKCFECDGTVSTQAATCPHCGAPAPSIAPQASTNQAAPRKKLTDRFVNGLFLIGCIGIALMFLGSGSKPQKAGSESDASTDRYWASESELQRIAELGRAKFEPKALIARSLIEKPYTLQSLVEVIQQSGYMCDTVSAASPEAFSPVLDVACDEHRHRYEIRDVGGTWTATVVF